MPVHAPLCPICTPSPFSVWVTELPPGNGFDGSCPDSGDRVGSVGVRVTPWHAFSDEHPSS